MSDKNKRYSATQINAELFWKFPKFLLENQKYENLSNDARVAYMLIKDRYRYSLSNQWIDAKGDVYVIFTIEQLRELLHVGKNKAISIKKDLINLDLLEIEKQGFDPKSQKNLPDKFYLLQPEYVAEDLISQTSQAQSLDISGGLKIKPRSKNKEIPSNQESSDCENCNNQASTLEPNGGLKTKPYKDKNNSDTIKDTMKDTQTWDFSSQKYPKELVRKQNEDLLNHLDEFLNTNSSMPMFLNKESLDLIKMWFRTPQEVSECISTILNAANDSREEAIEQLGTHKLNFEDYDDELKEKTTNALRRYFNKMRTTKKGEIKNPKNYLYISMKNLFGYWQNEILINRKDDNKNS
ncbi:replication initiator protein A (plasmid) [Lactobacillus sp. PV037]|uniref:replication initiator protein A n=1 Tax=unclassified Lactobacillus TaxID=2620435 RepID=UPI0022403301|nr:MULTISPECIES: replication initiator protein A [unclassified Lactobacillus]QNQ82914.1 replication initiator protein A [Lactobacillus sp. PV012]QNQ83018.1 replication initiator protein A [Lactobacillus sp. PV037]